MIRFFANMKYIKIAFMAFVLVFLILPFIILFTTHSFKQYSSVNLVRASDNANPLSDLCRVNNGSLSRRLMTINALGRLGNLMGQYATLYTLSKWNDRPAFMLKGMSGILREYFQVTMPSLDGHAESCLNKQWKAFRLHDWMDESYKSLEFSPDQPIQLTGFPCSWTFYDDRRDQILREFKFKDHIAARAQETLRSLMGNRSTATFVGVHARRSDYVHLMEGEFRGMVADSEFFAKAMTHFRSRYADAIFVVASDDMEWCRKNINNSLDDVRFAGIGNIKDPISDFALLSQCNHSIITIGTYGYWTAYLAGGDTVYFSNYTRPDSPFLKFFHYDAAYLPSWTPIAADMSHIKGLDKP